MSEPTIESIETRLAAVDAKVDAHQNSLIRRLSLAAGVAAFLISLVTIYDRFFTKPEDEKVDEYHLMTSDIRAITAAKVDVITKSSVLNPTNTAVRDANYRVIESLAEEAGRLIPLLGPEAKDPKSRLFVSALDYDVLSGAAQEAGNPRLALKYLNSAIDAANTAHVKSDLLREMVDVSYQVSGQAAGTTVKPLLVNEEKILATENDPASDFDASNLYASAARIDGWGGHCKEAWAEAARSVSILSNLSNQEGLANSDVALLASALPPGSKCPYADFPIALRNSIKLLH